MAVFAIAMPLLPHAGQLHVWHSNIWPTLICFSSVSLLFAVITSVLFCCGILLCFVVVWVFLFACFYVFCADLICIHISTTLIHFLFVLFFCLFLVGWLVGWLGFSEASSLNVARADLKITILLPQSPASEPHACLHLGLFMHQLSRINLLPSLRKQRTCRTIFKLLSHRRKGNTQLISSPIKTFLQHHTHSSES